MILLDKTLNIKPLTINQVYYPQVDFKTKKASFRMTFEGKRYSWLVINQFKKSFGFEMDEVRSAVRNKRLNANYLFYFPSDVLEKKFDLDNLIKPLQDNICRTLLIDDRYIFQLHAYKELSPDNKFYTRICFKC